MYLGETDFGLQEIWNGVFNIYTEFSRVCEKNNLRYFVSDGSALGAVRHGGFIPWDDDFDVSMPRPDYEKFLALASDELPEYLKIVTWRNTPAYNLPFAKIQDARESVVKRIETDYGKMLSNGIFMDILPIDGAAKTGLGRMFSDKWFRLRRVLMRYRFDSFFRQTTKGKLYWVAGMLLSPFFPFLWGRSRLLGSYEHSAKSHNYDESEMTIRPCSNVSYRRRAIPRSVWGKPTAITFGETTIMVAEKIKDYLVSEYGDYMKLPPEENRQPSHQYQWRCPWWLGPTDAQ